MADFVSALMSSTYNVIKTFCTDSRNNENLLRSNFSGTSFPSSPVVGQTCYREDLLKEYQWNGTTWVESGSNSIISNDVHPPEDLPGIHEGYCRPLWRRCRSQQCPHYSIWTIS